MVRKTLILICDSREQNPISFDGIEGIEKVEVSGMAFGDYGAVVREKIVPIVFERKSIQDLFGTLGAGHDRFRRELERAKTANFKLVLMIEGTYTEVWGGCKYSQMDGPTVLKVLATMYVKYDLEYYFCESRRVMARRITDFFAAVERNWAKENSKTIANLGEIPSIPFKASTASFGENSLPEDAA